MHHITVNGNVRKIDYEMNALKTGRWVEAIAVQYAACFSDPSYRSVFLSKNPDRENMLIGAVGRLIGMRVRVCRTKLEGAVDYRGETVFACSEENEENTEGFDSLPFQKIFALCNRLMRSIKAYLPGELQGVPFLGGVKSILLCDRPQDMVDFYLPELAVFGTEKDFRLFHAAGLPADELLAVEPAAQVCAPPAICRRSLAPTREEYLRRMDGVMKKLKDGVIKKIIVARKCTVETTAPFDPFGYAEYLIDRFYQEYFYLFRHGPAQQWIGITPENLFKQRGRQVITIPLAGTIRKTGDAGRDAAALGEATPGSNLVIEHESARDFMVSQLKAASIGKVILARSNEILEMPYAYHLMSEIHVELDETATCFDLLAAMYPPAAVWGIPVNRIEPVIAETEPFAREFYSGLYGYWDFQGNADIALVIRSAKLDAEDRLSVYIGSGIIDCADPEAEWAETESKMQPLVGYFANSAACFSQE